MAGPSHTFACRRYRQQYIPALIVSYALSASGPQRHADYERAKDILNRAVTPLLNSLPPWTTTPEKSQRRRNLRPKAIRARNPSRPFHVYDVSNARSNATRAIRARTVPSLMSSVSFAFLRRRAGRRSAQRKKCECTPPTATIQGADANEPPQVYWSA